MRHPALQFARTLAGATLLLALTLACGQASPRGDGLATGETFHTLEHNSTERSYILYTPPGLDSSQPAPLVFVFHGGGGDAQNAILMSGMDATAQENRFLVVYPNGSGRLEDKLLTWNGGTCCGFAQQNDVDDLGFVRAILADLQSIAKTDPKRIYATGMSNGGIMSYRLACEASDIFAAIAPVAGTLNFAPCKPQENISVIHFHGTADEHVPYNGGAGDKSLTETDFASVQDSINFWTAFDGCDSQPQTNSFEDVQHQVWGGCAGNSAVEFYAIIGGKHAWPGSEGPGWAGGDEPTRSINASSLIWEFFAAHPKP